MEKISKYPRHLIKLIEEVGREVVVSANANIDEYIAIYSDKKSNNGRDFMKEITCQVLSITPDILSGTVSIDVRVVRF